MIKEEFISLLTNIQGKLPFDEPSVRQLLQKVKSGGYTMPSDVPDLIADLIRKILVVDPQKRITLKGIKAHPAFRSYLPPEYPLPVPLPLPSLRDPIDPSTIEPFILSILKAIGYASEDDVKKELLEDHQTMAKVFYHMSVTRMSIEGYEWSDDDESENEDSNHNNEDSENQDDDGSIGNDPFMMPPREIPTMSIQTSDPFKRRRINNEVSSMDSSIRSLAQPVGWGETDVPESVYEDEQIFTSIQAPLSTLIVTLIKMIGKHEMEWKYPDDMTLICRRMDKTLYILFKIYYETKDTLDLQVLLNRGSSHEFNIFIQYVMTAIESMMNEIEEVKC
ncbi:hypothetical protein TRFO_07869 [Tritrichomonas foetus]|uniref:Protein kinase domain-containing protein n=1 Tax=Tritrichomonas foetus TaxID=1144522 RepID=A0A1J4JQ61_9EUKA|nr:hypothetical protein TRFO_07869 [Tritrichomonas foetus]|eukprot:OHT00552.1 hypothetical protein TRFO_07869 [Tritrichomonas foetus]